MNNEKRLLVALLLSLLVISGYQGYVRRFYKPQYKPTQQQAPKQQDAQAKPNQTYQADKIPAKQTQDSQKENIISIKTPLYQAVLTDQGASINEIYLLYTPDKTKTTTPILITKVPKGADNIFETIILTDAKQQQWALTKESSGEIIYEAEDLQKHLIKKITFYNSNYLIGLELNITNKTDTYQDIAFRISGGCATLTTNQTDDMHTGADVKVNNKIYRKKPSSKMKTGIEAFDGIPSWASTRSRYFASILKPEQPEQGAYVNIINATTACSGILSGPIKLKPNETINRQYMLYLGPNNADTISKLGISPSEITGYWVSNGITNMLLKIMRFFYNIFGNYGIAIIILTLLISTVMFPLTRKSLRSMKEMQKIQPEVEKIKKEYSNNQQKMNKEIMELYKKYKINPLGGCLPMLLQVPVFLSLFQALPRSLDLKDARFLWIKDLSAPDALFKLPTPLPILGNSVNILPITMALVMFIQQKISTPGGEVSDQQRMMATITPIMFGFFFYNISSGLVLYWLISTSYTLFMQEIVLKSRLSK